MQIRYYIINSKTDIMHIYGYCEQTKPRKVPIRLFEDVPTLENYAGRKLRLCKICQKKLVPVQCGVKSEKTY